MSDDPLNVGLFHAARSPKNTWSCRLLMDFDCGRRLLLTGLVSIILVKHICEMLLPPLPSFNCNISLSIRTIDGLRAAFSHH